MHRLALLAALASASLLFAACDTEPDPSDDDDVVSFDDDDTIDVDDDDATPPPCSQPAPPYTVDLSGAVNETVTFDSISCTPYGGDEWNVSLSGGPWLFRFVGGPFVTGADLTTGVQFDLQQPNDQRTHNYGGDTKTGHVGRVTIERGGDDGSLCGTFETDALVAFDNSGTVAISGQPLSFACP